MIAFLVTLLIGSTIATDAEFSYEAQQDWPPVCVTGNEMRQSPIDILTANVNDNENLIDLQLSGWETGYDGNFANNGHTVKFTPDAIGGATTRNHLGTYQLLQLHLHWGRRTGEGSEHLINGIASDVEIHFVHLKEGANGTVRSSYAVIGVLAQVEATPITGPWLQLNATAVEELDSSIPVTGFRFDQLLPENRDYYYYEGSFTTPPCTEIVEWFVLKDTITIPSAYVEQLRQTREISGNGTTLEFNFRMPQAIGDRVVTTRSSQAGMEPTVSLLTICLVLIKQLF